MASHVTNLATKSRMRRTETPKPIWIKFCMVVDIPDVVTYTNFGDHRLRGFWVAGGQISPSLIDFHRRPYNTLALPCECVIRVECFVDVAVGRTVAAPGCMTTQRLALPPCQSPTSGGRTTATSAVMGKSQLESYQLIV